MKKEINEDTLYAHWCSSTDKNYGKILDWREYEQEQTLAEFGYSAEGDNLIKNGEIVGVIRRGLQRIDFSVPYPSIVP